MLALSIVANFLWIPLPPVVVVDRDRPGSLGIWGITSRNPARAYSRSAADHPTHTRRRRDHLDSSDRCGHRRGGGIWSATVRCAYAFRRAAVRPAPRAYDAPGEGSSAEIQPNTAAPKAISRRPAAISTAAPGTSADRCSYPSVTFRPQNEPYDQVRGPLAWIVRELSAEAQRIFDAYRTERAPTKLTEPSLDLQELRFGGLGVAR